MTLRRIIFAVVPAFYSATANAQTFTLEVSMPSESATSLVRFDDPWYYHKGTNAPSPAWQSQEEATLDGTWLNGAGGFGFAADNPAETRRCGTILNDMYNRYSTLYVRRTFEVADNPEPTQRLLLTVDWDDGFVAYLDGVEIQRFNAPGQSGDEPTNSAVATADHESANGNPENLPQAATTFDLGPVGSRLAVGRHVLAIIGLNRAINNTDFLLAADLSLAGRTQRIPQEGHFALVKTNLVILSGTNTLPDSTRVVVNGAEAWFDLASCRWRTSWALKPGMNRLFLAALAPGGAILYSTNKDIVAELSSLSAGGVIATNTTWDAAQGVVTVTNSLTVAPGATLTLTDGAVVLFRGGSRIEIATNGSMNAVGNAADPIFLMPESETNAWGGLAAVGTNSSLSLHQVELVGGPVRAANGGSLVAEDCVLRDLRNGAPVMAGEDGAGLTLRRTQVLRYGKISSRRTPFLAEDCLFEGMVEGGLDLAGEAPAQVRRCTFRHGLDSGDLLPPDALAIAGDASVLVDGCIVQGFPGKGLVLGEAAHRGIVRNSLFYSCGSGIVVRGSTNCVLVQNTVTDCGLGVDFGPGTDLEASGYGTNLIIWGNASNVVVRNSSALFFSHSDVQGGLNGEGNLASDPLFQSPLKGDFRLHPGSPAIGSGLGGLDMGVLLPTGGLPSAPVNATVLVDGTNELQLTWQDTCENEAGFIIERSGDSATWLYRGDTGGDTYAFIDAEAALGQQYFYRVRATNTSGSSLFSNIAGGVRQPPATRIGGTLTRDLVWSPGMGTIAVTSSVVVPANVRLTILAGTTVRVTNHASLLAAAGGIIELSGQADNRVSIGPSSLGSLWGGISAQGPGALLKLQYADISAGQTTVYSNAVGWFEHCYFHDYRNPAGTLFTLPIVLSSFAAQMTLRRCHVREYYETLFRDGVIVIEDSLFEYMSGDALDFDGAQPGTVLRRSTFRHGTRAPSNIDAVDLGPGQLGGCRDVLVENCLVYDFPTDKGVSIGDAPYPATGTVVRNCLIFNCFSGVQVKDNSVAEIYNCTLASNRWGFTNYNKANPSAPTGGGHITNAHNNILWGNGVTISMSNGATLTGDHSDFGNTDWPGTGNIDADPQFVNAAEWDYRLGPNSPCRGTGRDGADMGAHFPVGAPMAASHPRFEAVRLSGTNILLCFWVEPEKSYTLAASASITGPWTPLAEVPVPELPKLIEVRDPLQGPNRFYRIAGVTTR